MFWLGIAEGSGNFTPACRPDERGDLRLDIDCGEASAGKSMVEVDRTIVRSAACGNEAALPGAERDRFDCGAMELFVFLAAFADEESILVTLSVASARKHHRG